MQRSRRRCRRQSGSSATTSGNSANVSPVLESKEGKPYLGAKLAVGCNNGDFDNGDHQHYRDRAEKAENVVIASLVLPQILEDKEEFNEQDSKRNQASQQGACVAPQIPGLGGNLPRNGVGLERMIPWLSPYIAKPAANVNQGNLDE